MGYYVVVNNEVTTLTHFYVRGWEYALGPTQWSLQPVGIHSVEQVNNVALLKRQLSTNTVLMIIHTIILHGTNKIIEYKAKRQ